MATNNMKEENQRLLHLYRAEKDPKKKSRLENQIAKFNEPFVKNKARKFFDRSHVNIDLDDLVQAGMIGLLTAIRKDQGKSAFTTYAAWWIFHELQNISAKTLPVHRPKGAGMPYKAYRASEAFKAATGEEATDADLGVPAGTVEEWRQSPVFFPLDEGGEGKSTIDRVPSADIPADLILDALEDKEELAVALECLPADERENVERIYFLNKKGDPVLAAKSLEFLKAYLEDE